MDDLFKALEMFSSGVQQGATLQAVNEANVQMQQINQAQMNEMQKRTALQDLGNQLALRMIGTGANAAHVEQAFKAITPQNFGSVEQMQLEGELSGNKQLLDTSSKILGERQKRSLELERRKMQLDMMKEEHKSALEVKRELVKNGIHPQQQKAEDIAFATNIKMADQYLNELETAIVGDPEKGIPGFGTFETGIGSEDAIRASATLSQVPYKLAVTWSKLVDPNSTAREGEVKAFEDNMELSGLTVSNSKAMANIQQLKESVSQYAQARAEAKGSGMPVPAYPEALKKILGKEGPSDYSGKSATNKQAAPSSDIMTLPDGRKIKYEKLPDGNIKVTPIGKR